MMRLESSELSILQAVFGMGTLTFAMFIWMSVARLPAMKRAGLTLSDAQHTEDLRPRLDAAGRKAGDNYNHLFEAPVVFYAVALGIVVAGMSDPLYAAAAWTYLATRVLHSLTQATINKVPVRLTLYLASWAALGFMIVRGLLALLSRSAGV
jgi:hypothetical protein